MRSSGQTHIGSLVETVANVGSGFLVSLCLWHFVVEPWLGISPPAGTGFSVVALFTVASVIRGYLWRRIFNKSR